MADRLAESRSRRPEHTHAGEAEIMRERGEARCRAIGEREAEFFLQDPHQGLFVPLSGLDRATEAAPMIGIEVSGLGSRSCKT